MRRALVLAGGGVAGIAWELGVLRGLMDADPALAESIVGADLVVGTSAGAAVAAQVTSRVSLDDLYATQLRAESAEIEVEFDMPAMLARFAETITGVTDPAEIRRRVGSLALDTRTVPEPVRHQAIEARLPVPSWPEQPMLLTAVDAETGEPVVFTRDSGVDLVYAVAASCAVPGIWPPVTIGDRRYMDGGARSIANADLATGCERVLVIIPALAGAPEPFGSLDAQIDGLKPAAVHVVWADADSVAAFGANPLSPTTRPPSAEAGRRVGKAESTAVSAFWR